MPLLVLLVVTTRAGVGIDVQQCEAMPIRPGFGNAASYYGGCAISHHQQPGAPDAAACRAACCANTECRSWGLDLKYPAAGDASCALGKPCCWLERCAGLDAAHSQNCSYGCVSGRSGRPDPPSGCSSCTAETCVSCPVLPTCPKPSAPVNVARTACDKSQLASANYSACEAACCADETCVAWNWDSVLPVAVAPAVCKAAGAPYSCCWLKNCAGFDIPKRKGFNSWSGDSGRLPSPPPPPKCSPPLEACGHRCEDPYSSGTPADVSESYDCSLRSHAWQFAKTTLSGLPRSNKALKTVYDALQLQKCNVSSPPGQMDVYVAPRFAVRSGAFVVYVNATAGDGGDGSHDNPFATIGEAVAVVAGKPGATIALRRGVHYVPSQIVLTAAHSGLTIQNYNGEEAVVTGALRIPAAVVAAGNWQLVKSRASGSTYRLDLSSWKDVPAEVFGMRIGTERAVKSRYPNGNAEQKLDAGYSLDSLAFIAYDGGTATAAGAAAANQSTVEDFFAHPEDWPGVYWLAEPEGGSLPNGGENMGGTGRFYDSAGGGCSGRQAPFGYWCSDSNSRGACPHDYWPHSQIVGGFSFNGSYPQIGRDAARAANWTANGGGGIVYHISGAFESAQCVTSKIDQATKTAVFDATQGCDQGPQLFQTSGAGLAWYAENIQEECDSAGEYYFGKSETGLPTLLFTFNGTEIPSGAEDFSLVTTKVLFNVSGSQAAPVKDITIRGLTIRDAALTFLGMTDADVHIPVSDSDWTIQRSGAVLIEGTEGFTFEGNLVTRVDGNGLKLSNYNRNASIVANEFSWIGDSAMSSLGSMGDCLYANCSAKLSYRGGGEFGHVNKGSSGVDGRGGNQPRHTRVAGNLVREVGLWQKQSSAWVQHLTAATQITGNVFMNGPHAMVSMNDGFGGADDVAGNLMMNSNRQTSVHGVINLWERVPYINDQGLVRNYTKARLVSDYLNYSKDGSDIDYKQMPTLVELHAGAMPGFDFASSGVGSVVSQFRRVHNNILIANYNALSGVTLDDAASRMLVYSNLLAYGALGVGESCHNSQWVFGVGNMYYFTDGLGAMIFAEGPSPTGIRTFFANNTFLNKYDASWCRNGEQTKLNLTQFWDNKVHSPTGVATGSHCNGGGTSLFSQMPVGSATTLAAEILEPYPKVASTGS